MKNTIMAEPKSGCKASKTTNIKEYTPEIIRWIGLEISACLLKKYLANKITKIIFAKSVG
jgi:hypothetical protein